MKDTIFGKVVAALMSLVMFVMAVLTPRLATAQTFDALWMPRTVSQYTKVTVPAEKWRQLIRVKKTLVTDLFSYEYRDGERWLTLGQEDAALVPGLTADKMSTLMQLPKREATMIFARYVPQENQLVINAVRVEEGRDGYMYLLETYFTPYSGENWAASRAFLTADERQDIYRAGRNPFEAFKGTDRTDPKFMRIGWDGAMVAVGLAMKHFRSMYSVISVQNLRMAQKVESSGSFLRKKTTIKIDGYAQPTWFIGLPTTVQNWGTAAAICVVPMATSTDPDTGETIGQSCPDEKLVAFSGVSFDQWDGGMLPGAEEHIYHWQETKRGFTVLFFTALVMAAAFFVGPQIYAAVQTGGFAGGAAVGSAVEIGGGAAALYSGAAYAGGTLLTTSGPASLTSVKQGMFGTVGDGTRFNTGPTSQQTKEASAELTRRHVDPQFDIGATCGGTNRLCSTQTMIERVSPDPVKVRFGGEQQRLREDFRVCRDKGLKGQALRDCVRPPKATVEVP